MGRSIFLAISLQDPLTKLIWRMMQARLIVWDGSPWRNSTTDEGARLRVIVDPAALQLQEAGVETSDKLDGDLRQILLVVRYVINNVSCLCVLSNWLLACLSSH